MLRALPFALVLGAAVTAHATNVPPGDLPAGQTVWSAAGSPWVLQGDVTVASGSTLVVEPGATVTASVAGAALFVAGELHAGRTAAGATDPSNPSKFLGFSSTSTRWSGIVVRAGSSGSVLRNTEIAFATVGLVVAGSATLVDVVVRSNGRGVEVTPTGTLDYGGTASALVATQSKSKVHTNAGRGIDNQGVLLLTNVEVFANDLSGLHSTGNATVTGCFVRNNGGNMPGIALVNALAGGTQAVTRTIVSTNAKVGIASTLAAGFAHVLDHVTLMNNASTPANATGEATVAMSGGTYTLTNSILDNPFGGTAFGVSRSAGTIVHHHNHFRWSSTAAAVTLPAETTFCSPLYKSNDDPRLTERSPARLVDASGGDVGAAPYTGDPTPGLMGRLRGDLTLTAAGSPWDLTGDLTVPAGTTLTIEPGATVRAAATDGAFCGEQPTRVALTIEGTLDARGTAAQPISLTGATASRGSWDGLVLRPTSTGNRLSFLDVTWAWIGVDVYAPSVEVTDSKVRESRGDAVVVRPPGALSWTGTPATSVLENNQQSALVNQGALVLTNSTIRSNGSTAVVSGGVSIISDNAIHDNTSSGAFGIRLVDGPAGGTQTVARNVITRNSGGGIDVILKVAGVTHVLAHNTLHDNDQSGSSTYEVYAVATAGKLTIRDNLATDNRTFGLYLASPGATLDVHHNLVWSSLGTNYTGFTPGAGAVTSNPLYVANGLRLTERSPARDASSETPPQDLGALPYAGDPTPQLMGVLRGDLTFTAAGSPWQLAGDLTVAPGVTLTVEPGAVVLPPAGDGMRGGTLPARTELVVNGRLVANGTAAQAIVFGTPTAGSWGGLAFGPTSAGNVLNFLDISGGYDCVRVEAPGVTFLSPKIHDCYQSGLHVTATGSAGVNGSPGRRGGLFDLDASIARTGVLSPTFPAVNALGDLSLLRTDVGPANGTLVVFTKQATLLQNRLHHGQWAVQGSVSAGAPANSIVRNLVYANASGGLQLTTQPGGAGSFEVDHNTISGNNTGAGVHVSQQGGLTSYTVRNNVIVNNGSAGLQRTALAGAPLPNTDYNLFFGTGQTGGTPGASTLTANPLLNATASFDFRLQPASPARASDDAGGDRGALPFVTIAIDGVQVSPTTAPTLATQTTTPFSATGIETGSGLPVAGLPITWSVAAGDGTINTFGVFTAGCAPGTYTDGIRATIDGFEGRATVTVVPGPAAAVTVTPPSATIPVNPGAATFTAVTHDACGNVSTEGVNWTSANVAAVTHFSNGQFLAGTTPGIYANVVRATSKVTGRIGTASVTVETGPLTVVRINPATAAVVPANNQGRFTATGEDAWGNLVPITPAWSVAGGCALGTIDPATGVFTAGSAAGSCTGGVVATAGGRTGVANVTVTTTPLATLSVLPAATTATVQGTLRFTASGRDAANTPMLVNPAWSVPSLAGTIDADGNFTAGCTPGTYLVTASQNGVTKTATVQVNAGPASTVVVSPASGSVGLGSTVTFTASGRDACNNTVPVTATWSVVAGGGTIGASSGVFTPASPPGAYPNTIRATVGATTGFASVTVGPGPLASVTISPTTATVDVRGTVAFTASGKDAAGNVVTFTPVWTVMEPLAGTIDATGLFRAGGTVGSFLASVRVGNLATGGFSATASVTVRPGPLASITLSPAAPSLAAGDSLQVTATGRDADGNVIPITPTWTMSAGGAVSAGGVVTAGTAAGTFANALEATVGAVTGRATVTVRAGPATSLAVTPSSVTLGANAPQAFAVTGKDRFGNPATLAPTWTMASPQAGTISAAGVLTSGTVAGSYPGAVVATSGTLTATADVTVLAGPLAFITVTSAGTVAIGKTLAFTALGGDAFGNPVPVTPTWSAAAGAGTITPAGLFTAGHTANTFPHAIVATDGSVTGRGTVVILPGPPASLELAPVEATLTPGGSQLFFARGRDAFDNPVPVPVEWAVVAGGGTISNDPVLAGQFIAGPTAGRYPDTIRATSVQGTTTLTALATVVIVPGPLASLVVSPATATAAIGASQPFSARGVDATGNELTGLTPTWTIETAGGSITTTGLATAGTRAGSFTVTARSGTASGTAKLLVQPDPIATLAITPTAPSVRARNTVVFRTTGADAYGNTVPTPPAWSVAVPAAGSITADGTFTAGPIARLYAGLVVAKVGSVTATADVTITPGPLASLAITPATVTLKAGDKQRFTAAGQDLDGNPVAVTASWSTVGGVGPITSSGELTAAETPGAHPDSVRAASGSVSTRASVTIVPADVVRVAVRPDRPTVAMDSKTTFTATAYGARDQVVRGVEASWAVLAGGGTVDPATGSFTAGRSAGTFTGTLEATIAGVRGVTTIIVPADFDADGQDDGWELANGFSPSNPGDALLDADDDGAKNREEFQAGTPPRDADADDDGGQDGREPRWNEDVDGDGKIGALDEDADGDGLNDGLEMGVAVPPADTDTSKAHFVPDADPTTSTDPASKDTDGDGLDDGDEDWGRDGRLDKGESDPSAPQAACVTRETCAEGSFCVNNQCRPARPCVPACAEGLECNFDGTCDVVENGRGTGRTDASCACGGDGGAVLGLGLLAFVGLLRRRRAQA